MQRIIASKVEKDQLTYRKLFFAVWSFEITWVAFHLSCPFRLCNATEGTLVMFVQYARKMACSVSEKLLHLVVMLQIRVWNR